MSLQSRNLNKDLFIISWIVKVYVEASLTVVYLEKHLFQITQDKHCGGLQCF